MRKQTRFAFAFALAVASGIGGMPVAADGLAGSYLAGRQASIASDYTEAARYFSRALIRDRNNPVLLENAAAAYLAIGDIEEGSVIAERLIDIDPRNQIAALIVAAAILGPSGDKQESLPEIGPAADGLLAAWSALDRGET
ncbi:MAG: tetratricopeptide repeat protein, partial [Pseudomonadota bacterium]